MFKALSCGEKINKRIPKQDGTAEKHKAPSHVLFKLALKDLLWAADYKQPSVRSVVCRTPLICFHPREPVRRAKGEGKAPQRTGYFDHRGSFETQVQDLKGQYLLIAFSILRVS